MSSPACVGPMCYYHLPGSTALAFRFLKHTALFPPQGFYSCCCCAWHAAIPLILLRLVNSCPPSSSQDSLLSHGKPFSHTPVESYFLPPYSPVHLSCGMCMIISVFFFINTSLTGGWILQRKRIESILFI